MSSTYSVHKRLVSIEDQWYWDGEPISRREGQFLSTHYWNVKEALITPWLTRDVEYDILGRVNPSRMEHNDG